MSHRGVVKRAAPRAVIVSALWSPEAANAQLCALQPKVQLSVTPEVAGARMGDEVLSELRPGDTLVVGGFEDLGSCLREVSRTVDQAFRRGVRVIVLEGRIDTSASDSSTLRRALRVAASYQQRLSSAEFRARIEASRAAGAFQPGRPRKIRPEWVAELRAQGLGASAIAEHLKVSRWTVYRAIQRLEPDGPPTADAPEPS